MNEYLKYLEKNTTDMSDIEKLRYAYMDLGMKFNFDVKYSLETNPRRKSRVYNFSGSSLSIKKSFTSNNIICRDTSEIMRIIGTHLGFNIRTVHYPLDESFDMFHVYNEIINEDGSIWTIDLQKDLKNIHSHMRTKYFGKYKNGYGFHINPYELEVIDRKIGYISDSYYNDDYYYYTMKNDVDSIDNFDDKLDFIFENIEPEDINIGVFERYFFHANIVNRLLTSHELGALEEITCYRKKGKDITYFPAFIVRDEKNIVIKIYVFDLNEKRYNKYTPIEFIDKINNRELLTKDYSLGAIKDAARKAKVLKI